MTPSFVFIDAQSTLTCAGITTAYPTLDAAQAALQSGESPLVVGAIAFHPYETPALFTPQQYWFNQGQVANSPSFTLENAATVSPHSPVTVLNVADSHSQSEYLERVARAVNLIRSGDLQKIVLSRTQTLTVDQPINPVDLLHHFTKNASTLHAHLVDLSSAGVKTRGHYLVGASPELLISKRGNQIYSHPLAGTAPRCIDPVRDQAQATELQLSQKNYAEHAFVTSEIKEALQPYCHDLNVPKTPMLTRTSHTWHLGTPIHGTLKDPSIPLLELVQQLHPTAAVNGYPSTLAQQILKDEEPDRGFYAGAFGWTDAHGNGEWRVTIRSVTVANNRITACAGGGIVADSDPLTEYLETETKLGPARQAINALNYNEEKVHAFN